MRTRVGVGARFAWEGEVLEVVALSGAVGGDVVLRDGRDRLVRMSLRELLLSGRARVIPADPDSAAAGEDELAAVVLGQLDVDARREVEERAAHVREVLSGFRSGNAELAAAGEPRPEYALALALGARYRSKAAELGVSLRTIEGWVAAFRRDGDAGLARKHMAPGGVGAEPDAWTRAALEVMAEYVGRSRPSRKLVIDRTNARFAELVDGADRSPQSRAMAYRRLAELEVLRPTFRLSAKRNAEIADRPGGAYGKLRPTRPGEYLLMDTTRLDVFGVDPVTLRWGLCSVFGGDAASLAAIMECA